MGTGPRGNEYLKLYDLCKEPYFFSCPGFQTLNLDASIKRFTGPSLTITAWDVLYYRLRANFDGLESKYYPEPPKALATDGSALYDFGKQATAATYRDNLLTIEYDDLSSGVSGSLQADLAIIADGSNSTIRRTLLPQLKNTYSGYVVWRGIVPELSVSEDTQNLFDVRFNVFSMKRNYIVG